MSSWLVSAITGPRSTPSDRLSSPGQRVNVSRPWSAGFSRSTSKDSRADIDDQVDRNPDADGEVPVEAVVVRVAVRLGGHIPDEEEQGEPQRVSDVEHEERGVKSDDRPRGRSGGVGLPACIEGPPLPPAD